MQSFHLKPKVNRDISYGVVVHIGTKNLLLLLLLVVVGVGVVFVVVLFKINTAFLLKDRKIKGKESK